MWAGAGGPPNPKLLARNAYISMIETAQNVADRYGLTREEIDAFALRSQQHAKSARDSGRLAKEIMPVQIPAIKKTPARTVEHDEFIRDDTTAEQLAALPVQAGTIQMTAANSTPLSDGASAVVLASTERTATLGVDRLARVVSSAVYALDPLIMGLAPALALALALSLAIKRAGLTRSRSTCGKSTRLQRTALGALRELPNQLGGFTIPDDKLTPNGGAAAIGHPLGATGARYVLTMATELAERNARYGAVGVCMGSGPAVSRRVVGQHIARPDRRRGPVGRRTDVEIDRGSGSGCVRDRATTRRAPVRTLPNVVGDASHRLRHRGPLQPVLW
jgi:3-oxo-5,6-didehydrosuberyl-CoA/3-oxoadipyl-CoA thiolase